VQACSDAADAPGAAVCGQEHAHALAQWRERRTNDWLLATLITARSVTAAELEAAAAARAVAADRPEASSLRFYAAHVYRLGGKPAEAKALLGQLADATDLDAEQQGRVAKERERI